MKKNHSLLIATALFISLCPVKNTADQLEDQIMAATTYRQIIDLYRISMSAHVQYRELCLERLNSVIIHQDTAGHKAEIDTIVTMAFADIANWLRLLPICLFHRTEYEDTLLVLHRINPGENYQYLEAASEIGTSKTARVLGEYLVPPYIEKREINMLRYIIPAIETLKDSALFLYPLVQAYTDSFVIFLESYCPIPDPNRSSLCVELIMRSPVPFAERMKARFDQVYTVSGKIEPVTSNIPVKSQPVSGMPLKNPVQLNGAAISDKNTTAGTVIDGGPGRVKLVVRGVKK